MSDACGAPKHVYSYGQKVEVTSQFGGRPHIPPGVYFYTGRPANSNVYHLLLSVEDSSTYIISNSNADCYTYPYVEKPEPGQEWRYKYRSRAGGFARVIDVTEDWVIHVHESVMPTTAKASATRLDYWLDTYEKVS